MENGPGVCSVDRSVLADGSGDPLLGQSIGSYRIARMIGRGGMGEVYRAVNPAIRSSVAIKVLSYECAARPAVVERFFAEARAANLIHHENIVNVLDLAVLSDRRPCIVMEYLEGSSLSALIASHGPLPLGWLARLVGEVLSALASAHDHGIVHRDLKPDNIWVTPAGHAKILDFGVAKLRVDSESQVSATRSGAILGTPHYMSPEQALGRPADPRSDIYSLGMVLHEGITGQRPFDAQSMFELLRMQIERLPDPPSSRRSGVPPAYEQCVLRALHKDPAMRFQSAPEFQAQLEHAASFLPVATFTPPPMTQVMSGPRLGYGPSPAMHHQFQPPTPPPVGTLNAMSQSVLFPTAPPRDSGDPGSMFRWAVLGTFAFLALGAMATVAVVLVVFSSRGKSVSVELPARPGSVADPASDIDADAGSSASVPATPQSRVIDVTASIEEAQKLARQTSPDAELSRIDAYGVDRTGKVDLGGGRGGGPFPSSVQYVFRSAIGVQKAKENPQDKLGGFCMIRVHFEKEGTHVYSSAIMCDSLETVRRPRCSAQQIWQRALERGVSATSANASLGYRAKMFGKQPAWFVTIGKYNEWIDDSC